MVLLVVLVLLVVVVLLLPVLYLAEHRKLWQPLHCTSAKGVLHSLPACCRRSLTPLPPLALPQVRLPAWRGGPRRQEHPVSRSAAPLYWWRSRLLLCWCCHSRYAAAGAERPLLMHSCRCRCLHRCWWWLWEWQCGAAQLLSSLFS